MFLSNMLCISCKLLTRSLMDRRVDSYRNRFLNAVVRASLGHMWESQALIMDGQLVFFRVLRFRQPLIKIGSI